MGTAINKPGLGQKKTVEPIRRLKDIKAIKKILSDKPRDLLLFTLGINNGLRAGDLLKLKVGQVRDLKAGDSITIIEGKTDNKNVLAINKSSFDALQNFLSNNPDIEDNAFLFGGRKGNKALTIPSLNRLIKAWTEDINLKGKYGTHTLRKTWGYIQRTEFGVPIEKITQRYLHSSPAITMGYLGLQTKEVEDILINNEI
ncbi:tyrosine-type recombinase/integrase [Desulfobacula sp.]|uniref:tyrosine-type recombinase/integrase n=1 Tax=Desulfobacula sp. TaxID=2593537 RepID=UPI00260E1C89|nr:tyrosine-type recombinase/integrase [Desulfobacula sp.]